MKNLSFYLFLFLFIFSCKPNLSDSVIIEEEIELLGQIDIEYIVRGTPPIRIGRYIGPNLAAPTFIYNKNKWHEIINMGIVTGDRIILNASLDNQGMLETKIIAKNIIIAEGRSNSAVNLQYIF